MRRLTRPARDRAAALVAIVAFVTASTGTRATDDDAFDLDPLPLTPLPLARPSSRIVDGDVPTLSGACGSDPLELLADRLPWGPGEALTWDITVLGVHAGRVAARTEERTRVDDVDVYPVLARARTDAVLKALGDVDASMVTWIDAHTATPVRMVNHVVTRELFDDEPSVTREDAAFAPSTVGVAGPRGGRANGILEHRSANRRLHKEAHVSSRADVVDVLAVLPWLRSRALPEGRHFCVDLFHRRRLYRVEGVVGAVEQVEVPLGIRSGRHIAASIQRTTGREPRPLEFWLSNDDERLPLLLRSPEGVGSVELRLARYLRGRPLFRSTAPAIPSQPPRLPTGDRPAASAADVSAPK